MGQLNAFVGHSFTEEDKDIVRVFLKFFDTVKNMNIGFTWEHAEDAKPKDLRGKVLELIEGKNLFIGICTEKEVVIPPAKLKRRLLNSSLSAAAGEFDSKTSDWIIQEIGLAIGREMELILLVENGLRTPGGLQGNLEYISFDRKSPEKCFEKILEMIQSLLPKVRKTIVEENNVLVVPTDENEERVEGGDEWLLPKPGWIRRDYEIALMYMMAMNDEEGEAQIRESYLECAEGKLPDNRASWDAFYEHRRIFCGKGGSLDVLKQIAKDNPENPSVLSSLGRSYQEYGDFEHAADSFKSAVDVSDSTSKKIVFLVERIDVLIKAKNYEEANKVALEVKKLVPEGEDDEAQIIKSLRDFAANMNNDDAFLGLSERYLSLRPNDVGARFDLAYKYSKAGLENLSLMHYLQIPPLERNSGTWNNLGVQFDTLKMFKKSVDAYRRGEEKGETLAMSNLAQKFLKVGFIAEAESLCTKALAIEDYHKNISHTLSRIKDIPDEEDTKENEVLEAAKPIGSFYRSFGHSQLQVGLPHFEGLWEGPDCKLIIKVNGAKFSAEGFYEQDSNALGFRGILAGLPDSKLKPTKYLVNYDGLIEGRSITGKLTKKAVREEAMSNSALGLIPKETDVLMFFSEGFFEVTVYEKNGTRKEKIYKMKIVSED